MFPSLKTGDITMKKGIKRRLVWSYLLLIIFTVVVFETIILSALIMHYNGGVKQTLSDQGLAFSSYYEQELIEGKFIEDAEQLLLQYNFSVKTQVQLIDLKGNVLAETHNSYTKNIGNLEDVKKGLNGETGYLNDRNEGEEVLSVSYPLSPSGTTIGVIRFTTSLNQFNKILFNNSVILVSIGGFVILLAAVVSFFLANTITKPVTQITLVAEQLATGKFNTRASSKQNDEIGKLADTLNFMAEQIQKHEQLKNEFIASVSHDLRTPLTSVKGWAVTLHSMYDDHFLKDGLEIIVNESDRLNILLSDLLDLSGFMSGKLSIVFENVSLTKLIKQVIQQMHPRSIRDNISLMADLQEDVEMIKADTNRMKQVLINLIDNALKFTPSGGMITVRLTARDHEILISIEDTGMGISEEELNLVKDKFYKGVSKGSGSGLGLAICEEIIKAHKGTFELKSESGKGTTAEIRLPM